MFYRKKLRLSIPSLLLILSVGLFSACGDSPTETAEELQSQTADYAFNEGQLLDDVNTAYRGEHERDVSSELMIEEMDNGNAAITVTLTNTMDGMEYPVHAHDAADPATTENGTPYNETPNADILASVMTGNGGQVSMTNETSMSYDELTNEYEGFYVVHDPTQPISTTDLTTYLVLGSFGQDLPEGELNLRSETFQYDFNEGQLLDDPNTAYDENGDHPRDLMAEMMVEELRTGQAQVTVTLMNTLDGEDYAVHSHDAADPDTTENGTPYNETPNADIMAKVVTGNGDSISTMNETQEATYVELINEYEGFFVVHDPTQPISTTDLTTYLILGNTAR
ncbi:hypothetical protein [Fodinibius sp. Rm-B-1B1-1]|uniref:hypothetical protein n=1 Tax=Fodinibius alkaliphilus TaxID=3140241 RepID=UPI00315A0E24